MDCSICKYSSLKGSPKDLARLIQQSMDENPDRKFLTIYPENWLEYNHWKVLCKEIKKNKL